MRNISYTPLLSKIFEAHILSRLQEEISLKDNQYGGVKKCLTTHMIVKLLQEVCDNAEDYRAATSITAIDYSKAFNTVSFQHCLEAFRKKGASTPLIRIIASFLTNRTMRVKVGQQWSDPLDVNGGCPHGSVLGVALLNNTTDDLEDDFLQYERIRLQLPTEEAPQSPPDLPRPPTTRAASFSTPRLAASPPDLNLSPVYPGVLDSADPEVMYKPALPYTGTQPVLSSPLAELAVGTQVLTQKQVRILKYINDNIICKKVNFGTVPISPEPPPTKEKQVMPTQNAFRIMTGNAKAKGMVVNNAKTNHICIYDALKYTPSTFFDEREGNAIVSGESIKILRFHLSSKPTVSLNVNNTVKKIRQRYHSLRHLARYGMNKAELQLK